ncbi:STAS domain-containing protein [Streptomyces sp. NPDC006332]|uniref:STAS domain-containing protein n=1 Tax=Streptomyces sp. NPDC006332 TaxID=3155456 RepID=UPI0033BB5A39
MGTDISLCHDGTSALVTVDTDIDHQSRPQLESAADDLPNTVRDLTLDLGHVVFVDSAVLYVIRDMQRVVDRNGGRLRVAGLTGQPRRLLRHAADLWPEARWDTYLRAS